MKKSILTVAMLGAAVMAGAAIPDGYYDRLEGLSGASLKNAVKDAASRHTAISYGDATWSVFIESDTHIVGSQRVWWDMYSSNNVAAPNSGSHPGMNIEHSVANSWWGGTKNDAYKDLMHLNPSDADANNRKANYPLGEVKTQTWSNGVTFVGKPASGTCGGADYVYEPADEYKGDFARAFFYMFTIYDNISWTSKCNWMYDTSSTLTLKPWAYELLLRWAKEDPVSQKEIDRNEVIYKHQKNRNPFIDCPELAEHIWGSKSGTPFHLDGIDDPGNDDPGNDDPGYDDPGNDDPGYDDPGDLDAGYWYAVASTQDLNERDAYVIVSTENGVMMSFTTGGSGTASYFQPCSHSTAFDNSVTPKRLTGIQDDAAVIRLSKNGASWIMSVSDKNGNMKGYLKSTATKKVELTQNKGDNGTSVTITPSTDKTSIKFGSIDGTLQYNNQENGRRFTTYTSGQESVMLYRLEPKTNGIGSYGTGLEENAPEVIIGIFDINGRKVAAETTDALAPGLYIVVSNFGTKKILK